MQIFYFEAKNPSLKKYALISNDSRKFSSFQASLFFVAKEDIFFLLELKDFPRNFEEERAILSFREDCVEVRLLKEIVPCCSKNSPHDQMVKSFQLVGDGIILLSEEIIFKEIFIIS